MPGSDAIAGGSSAMPLAIFPRTSASSSNCSRSPYKRALVTPDCCPPLAFGPYGRSSSARSTGSLSSDCRRASKSRGVATPSVTRLVSRSRSRIPSSSLCNSSRTIVCDFNSPTASRRSLISESEISGRKIHRRKSRAPMPVQVWSIALRRVAEESSPAAGSTNSRFRTVTESRIIASCCS